VLGMSRINTRSDCMRDSTGKDWRTDRAKFPKRGHVTSLGQHFSKAEPTMNIRRFHAVRNH
jgi:hypothetical protein